MKKIFIIFLFSLISYSFTVSQVKVNFFLSNFRDSVGYLMGDLMFTVLPGQVYKIGPANIRITDSVVGTGSLIPKADIPAINCYPNICFYSGFPSITTSSVASGAAIGCNALMFNTNGFYVFEPGTYRLSTLRWTKIPPLSTITLKFRVPPTTLATVIYDSTVLMTYNIDYTVGNPIVLSASNFQTEIPKEFNLYQNYPNPFNPKTSIKFDLPKSSFVTLKIYDVEGRELEVLVNQNMESGTFESGWDATKFASGIYFYRLTVEDPTWRTGDFVSVKKMVLLK